MKQGSSKTSFLNIFRLLFRNRFGEWLLLPFTKGKNWDHFFARIPANHYQYPKGSLRKAERDGFRFELDLSDYMQWLIYFGVSIEPRNKLYALVKPGMVIFDVGANIGETAMHFARRAGENGQVYAFEPDPVTFQKLNHHLELNRIRNVTALNFGLGDAEGQFSLERDEKHSGGNRIGKKGIAVVIKQGDAFAATLNRKPDFIKIDVEGFEYRVLQGLSHTIKTQRPVLYVETIDTYLHAQGSSAHDVIHWLEQVPYRLVNAFTDSPVHAAENTAGLHCDIIADPK